ncbi:hypothetical protein BMETH_30261672153, partial [methanotrophic bacterial endosymbiont of Bathymodiolus sp.]
PETLVTNSPKITKLFYQHTIG